MKKFIAITLLLFSISLISCTEKFPVSEYSPSDKKAELDALDALSDTIVHAHSTANELDGDYFDYYFANSELLENISDYVFYTSATTEIRETGVFKVKNEETKRALLEAIDTRKENLIAIYENYSPEDVSRAEKMLKGSFDDIVWFVITDDNTSVKEVIE